MMAKFHLYRVRLNSQGYDSFGSYFGSGAPLYRYELDDPADYRIRDGHVRGATREDAKQQVRISYPDARFYL